MDDQKVSFFDFGKHAVNCEFIVIFAQGTCDIVFVVTGAVLFSHHSDMMVCAVHGRAHEIYCTGVHANILFVGMFLMDRFGDKAAVRSHHIAPHFTIDRHI